MDEPLKERIYSPESVLVRPGQLVRDMVQDLIASRQLAWRLLVRNISAQYRQSLFGYLWAFVPPIFMTAVWVFLSSQRILNVGDTGMPYAVYVLVGMVFWQTFVEALNGPLQLVHESRAMLSKIHFPREALVLTGIGQVLFNFLVRSLMLVFVFFWFDLSAPSSIWLVPLGVMSLIALGTTVGLLLTPLGILYQDVGRAISFGVQLLFFLTPIIYPVPPASWAATLVKLNPVTPLLQTSREWLISGSASLLPGFFWVSAVSLLLLLLAWLLYRVPMPHLISRMNA